MTKKPITVGAIVRNDVRDAVHSLTFERDWKVRAAILEELGPLAQKGLKFERAPGSKNAKALAIATHVRELLTASPMATREKLFLSADRSIIETMPRKTFYRYVTAARRSLGIKSRPGRPRR